ncbi:MAG: alpha-E domain-containing protein [Chthoniobacteraceae bacterium]
MLSRVANCLYWMSRFIERADNTARIVDVNLQLILDFRSLDDQSLVDHWMPIIDSTGDEEKFLERYPKATGQSVTEFLVFDSENPNSILSSVCQARENARMVRDQITVELWEELNRLYLWIRSNDARGMWRQSPAEFFGHIKSASLLLVGTIYATIVHNEGWYFMQAGKFLERADKITRILDVRHAIFPGKDGPRAISQRDALELSAMLRSCSAWDAYKAAYGAEVRPEWVAEMLLLSDDFPRSVRFCVEKLDDALRRISGVSPRRFSNEAEKLSGRLLAELEYGSVEEALAAGFHEYLDQLQLKFNTIGDALFNAYIFQPFMNLEDEIIVQQEMQQQQSCQNAAHSPGARKPRFHIGRDGASSGNEHGEA